MQSERHQIPEDFLEVLDTDQATTEPLNVLLHCRHPILEGEVLEATGHQSIQLQFQCLEVLLESLFTRALSWVRVGWLVVWVLGAG